MSWFRPEESGVRKPYRHQKAYQGSFVRGENGGHKAPLSFAKWIQNEELCVRDAESRPKGGSRQRRDGAIANLAGDCCETPSTGVRECP